MITPNRNLLWAAPRSVLLASGELLLWEGAPCWFGIARRVFHVRVVAAYFALLFLADMATVRLHGGTGMSALRGAYPALLTGAGALAIVLGLAWLTGRTTRYTITTRRLVMQYGLALPATLGLPFSVIATASVRVRGDGSGDIPLRLRPEARIGYAKLWPHARMWRMGKPEPMLREVPHAGAVAAMLTRALVAAADARRLDDALQAPALAPARELLPA
jgi:hypothetical protein